MAELSATLQPLLDIERNFYDLLFTSPLSYEESYKKCLTTFQKTCEKLKQKNLMFVQIHETYFADEFSPLEYIAPPHWRVT